MDNQIILDVAYLSWLSLVDQCYPTQMLHTVHFHAYRKIFSIILLLCFTSLHTHDTKLYASLDSIEDNNKGHTRDILETYLVTPRYMELLFPNVVLHFFWDRLCFLSADFLLVPPRLVSLSRKLYLSLFTS